MRSGFQGQTGKQTKHRLDHFRVVEHTYWFIIENLRKLLREVYMIFLSFVKRVPWCTSLYSVSDARTVH